MKINIPNTYIKIKNPYTNKYYILYTSLFVMYKELNESRIKKSAASL